MSKLLTARYASECDACDQTIWPGTLCTVIEGMTVHAHCSDHADDPNPSPQARPRGRRATPKGTRR